MHRLLLLREIRPQMPFSALDKLLVVVVDGLVEEGRLVFPLKTDVYCLRFFETCPLVGFEFFERAVESVCVLKKLHLL